MHMHKKILIFMMILGLGFGLVACDLFNTTKTTESTSETTPETTRETSIISTTDINISTLTSESITTTAVQTTTEATTTTETTTAGITTVPTTQTTTVSTAEPIIPTGYSLLQDELEYVGVPSLGDVKVLVFAVDFSDYTSTQAGMSIQDIETAFNGASDDLDYESLNSFYQISSYGKLNLTADVFGFYRASETASYYEEEYYKLWATDPVTGEWLYGDDEVTYADSDIIYEVLSYYDTEIDYSDYDANNDGMIDGIYIIYNYPVSWTGDSDLWWAYHDYYAYMDSFDGVEPMYFVWSGYDFFTYGDDDIDARTIIHETGHMMGLDDYYDYYPYDHYNSGGLGGADMMDGAFGDHGPFSKILLGWVTPLVVEEAMTIDLLPFVESGEVILLIDNWNNTIFDEYLLITYYSPTGLNYADRSYLFTVPGILIYHVSAAIDQGYNDDYYYYSIFNNNNTDSPTKLIDIIEADMGNDIDGLSYVENDDLFRVGDVLGGNIYATYQWYNHTYLGYDVRIISMVGGVSRIEIFT